MIVGFFARCHGRLEESAESHVEDFEPKTIVNEPFRNVDPISLYDANIYNGYILSFYGF